MAARVQKSNSARKDLLEHFVFIGRSNPDAARRFLLAAGRTVKMLADMPELAGIWESDDPKLAGVRVWPIRGFENYLIFYRVRSDGIRILRILHAAQDINTAFGPP